MKKSLKVMPVILLIAIFATSCNLFAKPTQSPTGGEPNLTLTALFDTSLNIPPTVTPAVNTDIVLPTVAIPTVAPSETPTATAIPPTPTTVIPYRAPIMNAGYLATAPALDGTYETWLDQTYKYRIPYIIWKASNWKNNDDLEGAYAAAWDKDYLYVAVKITDDKYVQNKTGEYLYNGDSVEVMIDTKLDGDYYTQYLSSDDWQIGLSAGKKTAPKNEAYVWFPSSKSGSTTKIKVASLWETSPIYRIEAAIPWSMLGVTPTTGMHIGFAVTINDNDSTTVDTQQTRISTSSYMNFLDPTTWGELVLVK